MKVTDKRRLLNPDVPDEEPKNANDRIAHMEANLKNRPSVDSMPKVKCELTFGQVILIPHLQNLRESKMWNGAIYRILDMTFVRILNPNMPPGKPKKREIYVLRYDNEKRQYVYDTKDEMIEAMVARIKNHPEFSKGLEILL